MYVNNSWIQIIIKDPSLDQSQHKTLKKTEINQGKQRKILKKSENE